jgi:hypothetical protein
MPSRFLAFVEKTNVTLYDSDFSANLSVMPDELIIWTCKFKDFDFPVFGVLKQDEYYKLEPANGR